MTKAYSYLRFSTPEQMQGDSFRRQTVAARTYAEQHGLELDTELSFHDLGVSAFRGKNVGIDGQLGVFLDAVEKGVVPSGSYLLVESLDRISRQSARKALRVLEDIVEAGAVVVTLIDGRKYDKESLDSDPMSLLLSILTFMRAHEESAIKSARLKAAWSEKRARAIQNKLPLTRICPAWMKVDPTTKNFVLDDARVETIQRVFAMTLAGVGQKTIAHTFNQEGVPTFGKAKYWHSSYIAKLLESQAVYGILVPHILDFTEGKRVRRALEPIEGYFPSIIDNETRDRLNAIRSKESRYARRGKHAASPIDNIFAGLGRCAKCGGALTRTNKGDDYKYFVCSRAKAGAGCDYAIIPYQVVETCFLAHYAALFDSAPGLSETEKRIKENLSTVTTHRKWIDETMSNLMRALEGATARPATLLDRLSQLERERAETLKEEKEWEIRLAELESSLFTHRIDDLTQLLQTQPLDRPKINTMLRVVFDAVVIDRKTKALRFRWKHSDFETGVFYGGTRLGNIYGPLSLKISGVPVPELPPFVEKDRSLPGMLDCK